MLAPEPIAQDIPPLLEAFGRLHPAAVHVPVGLVVGAFVAEAFRAVQRRPEASPFTPTALLLAALGGLLAGATGWVFALDHGSGNDLFWHRWLGVAATAGCFGTAWLAARAARPGGEDLVGAMRGALVALTILVGWSGHLGANMVWGPGFVWEPIVDSAGGGGAPDAGEADGNAGDGDAPAGAAGSGNGAASGGGDPVMLAKLAFYREQVLPIFESRCYECHGNGKRKGGLRMDVRDSVVSRDDEGMWIVQPGKPAESVMITRVMLPEADDLSMPPEGDRLAAAQIEAIRTWIEDGAVMPESLAAGAAADARAGAGPDGGGDPSASGARARAGRAGAAADESRDPARARRPLAEQLPPLSDAEIAAAALLRTKGIHVAPVSQGASTFTVSVPGGSAVGDIDLAQVYPMAARVEELSLARSAITDAGAMAMPSMPNARIVRLDGTSLTDAGIIAVLSRTLDAETVNLVNTPATDTVFAMLAKLPHLERAYLFGSKVSEQGIAAFRKSRPGVEIILGDSNAP
ncbi:MAG: c-type cytochrome domain-containing protein [Phycisphaerales bacterium]